MRSMPRTPRGWDAGSAAGIATLLMQRRSILDNQAWPCRFLVTMMWCRKTFMVRW